MNDIDLRVSRADADRLLAAVRARRRKAEAGLTKFADNFDPVLGAPMRASYDAHLALEQRLKEAMSNAQENHDPRRAGRDTCQREGRRDAPGDYRPTRR